MGVVIMKKNRPKGLKYVKHKENSGQFKKGQTPWNKGKVYSKEVRNKIRLALSGENHPNFGKRLSKKIRDKISISRLKRKEELGYLNSAETRKKISDKNKGRKLSEMNKINIGNASRGRKFSVATIEKLRTASTGKIKSKGWRSS